MRENLWAPRLCVGRQLKPIITNNSELGGKNNLETNRIN